MKSGNSKFEEAAKELGEIMKAGFIKSHPITPADRKAIERAIINGQLPQPRLRKPPTTDTGSKESILRVLVKEMREKLKKQPVSIRPRKKVHTPLFPTMREISDRFSLSERTAAWLLEQLRLKKSAIARAASGSRGQSQSEANKKKSAD